MKTPGSTAIRLAAMIHQTRPRFIRDIGSVLMDIARRACRASLRT